MYFLASSGVINVLRSLHSDLSGGITCPGTGISYVTESARSKKSKSDSTIWAIIGFIIIVFVVLIAISN